MYHYLQYRPDKKESWHLVDERQLDSLSKPPAFLSVLKLDQDPEAVASAGNDPLEEVKYRGPMYFDLDCEDDIDAVLDASRELIDKLVANYNIDTDYMHCWLSGGKGVHITIPEQVFGVKRQTKYLPLIYRQIAKEVEVEHLDMNVYSAQKGRLWRCEGIPRPGSGTYKVGVTVEELMEMDAEQYETMVASARPPLERQEPGKKVIFPKAELAFKRARQAATKIVKAIQNAKTIPADELRKLPSTPGCIEKLITQGDCPDSNYNQAAMQVAAWIAARYTRDEEAEYQTEVIEPFIANVQSSSRPSEQERRSHVKDQINRAFSGRTKFSVGPLISTIGEPCHDCPLCRNDIEIEQGQADDDAEPFDPTTRIKETAAGYTQVSDNGGRHLTSFIFRAEREVFELEDDESTGERKESSRTGMIGTLTDDTGRKFYDFHMPETAWASKGGLIAAVNGFGTSRVFCSDADIQKLSRAILSFSGIGTKEGATDTMTQTRICGIHLDKTAKGTVTPAYIEADSSICAGIGDSPFPARFRYRGPRNLAPNLIEEDYPYVNDTELEQALDNLFKVNDPHNVARIAGWFAACHLREHIHAVMPQFPLLNIWGNAGAGKTMSALLFCHLNGMDYQNTAEPLNMENATVYPLTQFITNSTTVPRLVEEVNESLMHRAVYQRVIALFKAAWNRSTVPRGRLGNRGAEVDNSRVSSPIVYVSEQRTTRPALRERTIEVMLTAQAREVPGRSEAFSKAYAGRHHLFRAAKAMLHRSLTLSPKHIPDMLAANEELVPSGMSERPRFSLLVIMMGLDFMADSLAESQVDVRAPIEGLKTSLSTYLFDNFEEMEADKRTSEVDRVLLALDQMAADPEDRQTGLRTDEHYRLIGSQLSLNIPLLMSRYRRWCRSVGDLAVITDAGQMASLLAGESYFDRKQEDDERTGVFWHVINLDKLRSRGIHLANFIEGDIDGL